MADKKGYVPDRDKMIRKARRAKDVDEEEKEPLPREELDEEKRKRRELALTLARRYKVVYRETDAGWRKPDEIAKNEAAWQKG